MLIPKSTFLFQFESIFDEVSVYLEDVLAASHFGVTVSLAERCQKLGTRQDKYKEVGGFYNIFMITLFTHDAIKFLAAQVDDIT